MAIDRSVGHHAVIIVQVIQQLFAREDFTRFLGEGFQQAELGGLRSSSLSRQEA